MKTDSFLFAAGVALAMAFIFSCSSDSDEQDPLPPDIGNVFEIRSSSSQGNEYRQPSSSSEITELPVQSSSSSDVASPSNVLCMVNSLCIELNPDLCVSLGGTVVSFCQDLSSSSSSSSSSPSSSSSSSSVNASKVCENIFNALTHFCYNGSVYSRCNGMEYNPTTHICQGSVANPARCSGVQYNPLEQDCCVSAIFSLANQRCQSSVVETKCGTTGWYDASSTNLRCQNNVVETKCGAWWYDITNTNLRCQNNVVEVKCGSGWYDATNQRCGANNVIETKCGTGWYDATNQRCSANNVIETKCGSGWYDATNTNLRCQSNVIETRCGTGSSWYDATNANLRCQSNVVQTKCGTSSNWYDATNANLRCESNVIETRCGTGSSWYDATNANLRCQNNVVETKCGTGSTYYNSATQFCQNGTNAILSLCGGQTYAATEYCSNGTKKTYGSVTLSGQTYKTIVIGTQTWMAENLNYNASGSVCYDNNSSNCAIYGRLYNWSTAMGGSASSTANPSGVRGVCPEGWHLPSRAEWDVLSSFVGGSNTESKHLKAKDGWYNCGPSGSGKQYLCEDTYGFAALPGGYGYSDGSFDDVGRYGYWWTASEGSSSSAYNRCMDYGIEYADWNNYDKSSLRSVRCLKD